MLEERTNDQVSDYSINLEIKEWKNLNVSLKQHGLKSVSIMSFSQVKTGKESYVFLNKENSQNLRTLINVLMRDADRRQELVQDMIATNAQLRNELSILSKTNKNIHSTIADSDRDKKRKDLNKKYKEELKEVKEILKGKQEEVESLQKKYECFVQEELNRRKKSENVMEKLQNKHMTERISSDIISLIDLYERELMEVKKGSCDFQLPFSAPQPTIHFKNIIKSLERKLADAMKVNKELKETCKKLQNELQIKDSELKNRKVEKVYIREKSKPRRPVSPTSTVKSSTSHVSKPSSHLALQIASTRLVHLRSLPAYQCHQFLESVCSRLGVCDLQDIIPAINKAANNSYTFSQLDMFIRDMHSTINRYNLPRPPNKHCPCMEGEACMDKNCMLETLDFWVKQMRHLKELQQSLTNLSEKLFPWRPIKLNPKTCSTLELVDMVDGMLVEGIGASTCKHTEAETSDKEELVKIIKHFQRLFNVAQLSGVYAKMSYLYRRLNEEGNFISNIKSALKLDKSFSPLDITEAVSRLKMNGASGIPSPSECHEIERLKSELQIQENFCASSHRMLQELIALLDVDSVDQIIPSVQVLCNKLHHLSSQSHFTRSTSNLSSGLQDSFHSLYSQNSLQNRRPLCHSPSCEDKRDNYISVDVGDFK